VPNQFANGYALLVAVDENQAPGLALPVVGKDIRALADVLTHPQRCAYPSENVKVIKGKDATRSGILDGLAWLEEQLKADTSGSTTAVIYYSGHGWRDTATNPPTYYLVPYDLRENALRLTALQASAFADAVEHLAPHRLFVALDCCHAGGMNVKGMQAEGSAVPAGLFMGAEKGVPLDAVTKGLDGLALGSGRAVLSSSKGEENSYVRKDGKMSIFTYHLIEALTGHAQPAEGATEVLVSDIMSHVTRHVHETAAKEFERDQTPDFQVSGNFAVALLLGGKGLTKGAPAPDPIAPIRSARRSKGGVNTGGGAYVRGSVKIGKGDFIGRDKIQTGNISGSGIAIGRGAKARRKGR
jgi:hypothetical protein